MEGKQKMHSLELKIVNPLIQNHLPKYQSEGAAGLDLCACLEKEILLKKGETLLIPTGIAIHLNDPNLAAFIFPRSGLAHKNGIVLGNSVGVIDSDYQGEIKVSLLSRGKEDFLITPFARIAQMVVMPVCRVNFNFVENFTPTQRGEGGFGSTG